MMQALAARPALERVMNKIESNVKFFKTSVVAFDGFKKLQLLNDKTEGTVLKLI